MNFSCFFSGFSLELTGEQESLEQLLVDCRDTLKYGVKTGKIDVVFIPWSFRVHNSKPTYNFGKKKRV